MTEPAGFAPEAPARAAVTLSARPEPIRLNPAETAMIIVDMQNAYASPGGYLDIVASTSRAARR